MTKITDYQELFNRLVDLQFNSIMADRDQIAEIVFEHVSGQLESMGYEELEELAEYHGIVADLEGK